MICKLRQESAGGKLVYKDMSACPGCQILFYRGFRFLSSLYSDPREKLVVAVSPLVASQAGVFRGARFSACVGGYAAHGQHRKFPLYARKTSGTQGNVSDPNHEISISVYIQIIHFCHTSSSHLNKVYRREKNSGKHLN